MEFKDNTIMYALYDPLNKAHKSVAGGIPVGEEVVFTVVSSGEKCSLIICKEGGKNIELPAKKAGNRFSAAFVPKDTGLYFYNFAIDGRPFGMPDGEYASSDFGKLKKNGASFSLTVYAADYSTPDWIKGGAIYQIFPDRFRRVGATVPRTNQRLRSDWGGIPEYKPVFGKVLNNDFFGGTFRGITSSLSYIKKLGVTAIYLNPVFESSSNHRYDTGDYFKFDGLLGTEEDFAELVSKARENGISVILDGVFNHTGDDSRYFNKYGNYSETGAYNSKTSKYYGWYSFRRFPDEYDCWWGVDTLPQTNENDPSFREFICGENGVIRRYLRMGTFGWRLDVVDELPDNFVREIRSAVKAENPEALIIGEVWENVTDKIAYGVRREYLCGNELDSAMNYPLKNAIINFLLTENTAELASVMRRQIDCYPALALHVMMNLLGTHDTPRIINVLSGVKMPCEKEDQAVLELTEEQYTRGVELSKIAAAIEFTVYGVPSVYYGDEAGMTGWGDPFNRRCMNWNAGGELLKYYEKLGKIRSSHGVFKKGDTEIVYLTRGAICFTRSNEKERIYTAVNMGAATPVFVFDGEVTDLLTGKTAKEFSVPYASVRILREIL